MTTSDRCWFCKSQPGTDGSAAVVKLERIVNLPNNGWDLKQMEERVPRCVACQRKHRIAATARTICWLAAAAAAVMLIGAGTIFSITGYHGPIIIPIKPMGLMGLFAALALPFIGIPLLIGFGGSAICNLLILEPALPKSAAVTHEEVKLRLRQGWSLPGKATEPRRRKPQGAQANGP